MLMQAIKRIGFLSLLLPGVLAVALTVTNAAQAAPPAFQAFSAIAAAANGGADPTVTLPAHAENDILLLATIVRSNTATVATPAGWTQIGSPTVRSTVATYQFFWIRAGATTVPNPLINRTGTTGDVYAAVVTYRRATSIGDPWEVKGTVATGTADPSVITGITTLTADSLVVAAVAGEDNNNASIITTGTNPAAYTEHYVESAIGADGVITFSEALRTTAGATGNVSVNWDTAIPVGFGGIVLALKPRGTVLGNGTDPGNTALAPGGAATMADAFTFETGTGTDTITEVTVGLSAGSSGGLSLVEITNDAGTTVYGSVANPASDTPSITLSTNTLTATTTSTQYKIRITPKSHAAMPPPPGSTYSVTAKINSWTGTGIQEGTDTAGTTVTIDNLSSGDVTGATGTAGDTQVVLNWTNPVSPVETVAYSIVVLRSTAAVADTPVEGTTYAVGNTIGASTVRCVVTGLPPALTCTDTGLTNGTAYHYKIFTRDSNGNFSPGVVPTGSPFTPAANRYAVASLNWNDTSTWSAISCAGPTGASVPTVFNNVIICATRTVTVTAAGSCASLTFDTTGAGSTLQHNAGVGLLVNGNVTINGSTSADGTRLWNIGAGSTQVNGSVTLNGGSTNARIARIATTTGTLTVTGGLTYNASGFGGAARAVIDMSGGAGTLNLAGALTINTLGTLTPGTTSTFNFNGTAAGQTIPIGVSSVVYNNLYVNNTNAAGATLSAAVSAANVTGDVRVQGTSILNNGGFAIVGGGTKTFEVVNGARFNLTGTSAMASGFGTRTFGATSTVNFNGGNQTVASGLTYGHLILDGGSTKTMAAGTTTIAGDFTLGTGTTRAATNNPTVNLAGNFTNSGTFNAGTGVFTFNGSAAQQITGATTFGNVTFNNAAGVTANSNLSIVRNFTNTAGFNAGTATTTFSGTVDQTITGATTFHNLTLSNTNPFPTGTELTLNNDVTVNNTMSFVAGNVITGANALIIGNTAGCGVTGAGTGVGYVVGKLRKNFTASLLSCPFEIGDANFYTPVSALTFASVTTPGTVIASTTGTDHADLANSGINAAASVNRYWTLTSGGGLVFTTCGATFDYIDPDDLDAGVLPDDFIIRRKDGGTWSAVPVSGIPTTTQTSGTGITAFGDFAIGNPGFIYTRESDFIYTRELYY